MKTDVMDCACVIHSDGYSWDYVDRLYHMLTRNSQYQIKLHVFTEPGRDVPTHMIKHNLVEWPNISGPKRSWWYKMQMFNSEHFRGRLLYMDLDVVLTDNIDWIWAQDTRYFWAVHDFRYLWRSTWTGMNSSVMLWDTQRWAHIWQEFQNNNIAATVKQYHGDQDFLNAHIKGKDLRFLDSERISSWRWQIKDGGMDMRSKLYHKPGAGAILPPKTSMVIFHGSPKPHEVSDPVMSRYWNK